MIAGRGLCDEDVEVSGCEGEIDGDGGRGAKHKKNQGVSKM